MISQKKKKKKQASNNDQQEAKQCTSTACSCSCMEATLLVKLSRWNTRTHMKTVNQTNKYGYILMKLAKKNWHFEWGKVVHWRQMAK